MLKDLEAILSGGLPNISIRNGTIELSEPDDLEIHDDRLSKSKMLHDMSKNYGRED